MGGEVKVENMCFMGSTIVEIDGQERTSK